MFLFSVLYFIFGFFVPGYKDSYHERKTSGAYNHARYDIPISAIDGKKIAFSKSAKYGAENGVYYIGFRRLQYMCINRVLVTVCFIINLVTYLNNIKDPIGMMVYVLLLQILNAIIPYYLIRKDTRRIRQFSFIVSESEPDYSVAKGTFPWWLTPATLLDVFFWLGDSQIYYCENGNLLAYIMPNGKKIIIRLKNSFTEFPDKERTFNPAQYEFIEQIYVVKE